MSLRWDMAGAGDTLHRNELPSLVPELHALHHQERPVRIEVSSNLQERRKRSGEFLKKVGSAGQGLSFSPAVFRNIRNYGIISIAIMRSISKKVALLCLLLTVCSVVAFAAHHHSSATDAAKCTVCVAAHSASPKAVSILPKADHVFAAAPVLDPISAKQRLISFALRVRPPPSV